MSSRIIKGVTLEVIPSTLYVVISLLVLLLMNSLITKEPIRSDAQQNLRMGYHLYKHGVISKDGEVIGKPEPTNYREPVPPIVTGLFMYLHPGIDKEDSLISFEDGVNTTIIKQVNLIWLFLLQIGVGLLSFRVSRNKLVPFLALFLIFVYFIRFGNHFDDLNTELPCAVWLIWSSYLFLEAANRKNVNLFVLTGIAFGLLILTKAIFYYVVPVLIVVVMIYQYQNLRLKNYVLLILSVAIIIGPWMIRNYSIYGELSITQRGGTVLYQRAMLNQMNGEEIEGAIYLWGPQLYRKIVNLTPFEIEKDEFLPGGTYQRLVRDQVGDSLAIDRGRPVEAISYYGKTRAEINRLQSVLGEGGAEAPRSEVFDIMEEEGRNMILQNPIKHGAMSLLFLWRGIWTLPNATIPLISEPLQSIIHNLINLCAYISLFLFCIYGFIMKRDGLFLLSVLPVITILIQAGVSHNISRFSEPAIPSMLIAFSLILHQLYLKTLVNYSGSNLFAR